MALEKQVVSLTLAKGMDTKTDSKQQVPGSLVLLENGRFSEPGKIKKRPGYDALRTAVVGSSDPIVAGTGLTGFMDELLLCDGTEVYSYSSGNEAWVDKGPLFNIGLDSSNVVRNNYQQTSQDSCYHSSGLQCFVWEDSSGGSRYSIVDYTTKLQIVADRIIADDATKPKAFALGNYFVILYHDTSEADIKKFCIPIGNPTSTGVITNVATDPQNNVYDALVIGSRLFVAYNNTSGDISVRFINAFLVTSAAETITGAVATSITLFTDDFSNVWLGIYDGTSVKVYVYSYDRVEVLALTTVETVADVKNLTGSVIGTTATLYYDITSATVYNYLVRKCTVTLAGSVGTPAVFIRSLALGSKSFIYKGVIYVVCNYASTYQPTSFVLNGSGSVVAKLAPLQGAGIPAKNVLPQVNLVASGQYQLAYLEKNTTTAVDGVIVSQSGVMQATIDFTISGLISTELASNLHLGGGFLAMYDGASVVEHGFHLFPETPSGSEASSGSIAAGTYQYVAVYEWMDNFGNIHRSAPSIPVSVVVTGGSKKVNLTIPTLRVTAKTDVAVVLYRTEASGTVFYRISSLTAPTINSTSADTVAYEDTVADASIIGNNQLYTTGGEVENISAPASTIFVNFKNRIILIPTEDQSQWWYSKQAVPGFPVEFSDLFVNNMDQYGGKITAVGVSDDKLVFFKENTKFYVYGNGPAANGANNDFSNPERITGDTGCVNQRSIVSTPLGLMYQSPKGIYLLDRALVDKYVGAPVEGVVNGATVTSAVLIADANQVRFTLDSGSTVVYDYFVDQWSVDTGLSAQDSTLWRGSDYALIRSSGQVLIQNPDIFTDAGRFVKLKLKTGWINFAQVQGFQRVWKMLLLGEYVNPHSLIVSVAENFNDTAYQQTYINGDLSTGDFGDDATFGDSDYFGGTFPLYQFRLFLSRQKCQSLQITIEDARMGASGESYSISNLAFEVGVKKGANKVIAGKSYG